MTHVAKFCLTMSSQTAFDRVGFILPSSSSSDIHSSGTDSVSSMSTSPGCFTLAKTSTAKTATILANAELIIEEMKQLRGEFLPKRLRHLHERNCHQQAIRQPSPQHPRYPPRQDSVRTAEAHRCPAGRHPSRDRRVEGKMSETGQRAETSAQAPTQSATEIRYYLSITGLRWRVQIGA